MTAAAPRTDALHKIRGAARYAADNAVPGQLHGVIVRSAQARAELIGLDLEAARQVPGVVCVLGPGDVPDVLFGDVENDEPLLARGDVRHIGQPIALVAAESLAAAQAAARAVSVAYDPRPPVVTLRAAIADDAPQVVPGESNVLPPSSLTKGDPSAAFAAADVIVVETEVDTQRVNQGYIELRTATAHLDLDGRLHVSMCSQAPFQVRAVLARLFSMRLADVVVTVPTFGGGFGGKLHHGMAPYAAALAIATGRPVRVVCPREEDLAASHPREGSLVRMRSAVAPDGRVLARDVLGYFDSGAFTIDTPYITSMGAMQACGPYDIAAVRCAIHAVRTNLQPTGSFRAPSGPQMAFAVERHMDDIAVRVGVDRVALRRLNLMRDGSLGPSGQVVQTPVISECIDRAEAQLQVWREEQLSEEPTPGVQHGFALAAGWWFTSAGGSAVTVRLEEDGGVSVYTGATEIGTGAVVTGLRNVVASAMAVAPTAVRIISPSTESAPPDFGSEGSRTLYGAGNAALAAVDEVRAILAQHLEINPRDLLLADGRAGVVGVPESLRPLGEVVASAASAGGAVMGKGRYQASSVAYEQESTEGMLIPAFREPTFHCQGAWIEVDSELGKVRVRKYVAVHDVGFVVDEDGLRGQVEGGVAQGIGYALYEEQVHDDTGRVLNPNLVDYRLPTAGDVPEEYVTVPVVSNPSGEGPLGAKGIGEAPVILPAAVLAAAIQDATGLRLVSLPMTPERISLSDLEY